MEKNNTYRWSGRNRSGEKITGEIESRHLTLAKHTLLSQGILVNNISPKRYLWFINRHHRVTPKDISMFTQQISTLIQAGIPLVQACDIIAKTQHNPLFKRTIVQIKQHMEEGNTFAESLAQHPKWFNPLFIHLIKAGEKSGTLDMMLTELVDYQEKMAGVKQKIKKAVRYPLFILCTACLVTLAMLIWVVPQFEILFNGFSAELPTITRITIRCAQFTQNNGLLIIGALTALISLFLYRRKYSSQFSQTIDKHLLRVPFLGAILKHSAIARLSRTLAITFAAGLPLTEALKLAAGATGHPLYAEATDTIRYKILNGQSLQTAIQKSNLFPTMVVEMIAVGENAGKLETMLTKIADFYERSVDEMIETLGSLLEPIIMVILGVLIGGLVIAMYLPIFKLGSVI